MAAVRLLRSRGWLAALALSLALAAHADAPPERPLPFDDLRTYFPEIAVVAHADRQCVLLDTLLAATAAQRARGLMFVTRMPANSGMLFHYPEPRLLSMWMKNTLIPLDMLFIDTDGVVVNVIARAEPQSLASRRSAAPARFVLELNGGRAAALGLTAGSRLTIDRTNPGIR